MNFALLFNTLSHLRTRQILYQLKNRFVKEKYKDLKCPMDVPYPVLTPFILKYRSLSNNTFSFLNQPLSFSSWNDTTNGMLWAYNQNYMDWLIQEGMTFEEGAIWIDKFVEELPLNRIGLDPYPIALRSINWIKFISLHKDSINKEKLKRWNNALYSQYSLLEKKLEYHLLGNHLLEDAYSLFFSAIYFQDVKMYKKSSKLLLGELKEQILEDGAHYEQSPMYHCILLDRLLDCYNMAINNILFEHQKKVITTLKYYCVKMLGHLESILYQDSTYPLFNDATLGIAPSPKQLFDYARRLDLQWEDIPLKDSGYRKLKNANLEAFIDIGNITATYQPGHSHADTFNYELKINGKPFIIDTGISTYDKTKRRQYERSTEAHNCVTVNGKNSSEVWGGFRVGKRCKVTILKDSSNHIEVYHHSYKNRCYRLYKMLNDTFFVEDRYDGNAVSYIHLAPNADINKIKIEGSDKIEVLDTKYSNEYNKFISNKTIAIHFNGVMRYSIEA